MVGAATDTDGRSVPLNFDGRGGDGYRRERSVPLSFDGRGGDGYRRERSVPLNFDGRGGDGYRRERSVPLNFDGRGGGIHAGQQVFLNVLVEKRSLQGFIKNIPAGSR